jgi:hypothetical protein
MVPARKAANLSERFAISRTTKRVYSKRPEEIHCSGAGALTGSVPAKAVGNLTTDLKLGKEPFTEGNREGVAQDRTFTKARSPVIESCTTMLMG